MKFIVEVRELAPVLAALDRIAPRAAVKTIPILAHLKITAAASSITLAATDLHIRLEHMIPAEVAKKGEGTIACAELTKLVKKLPEGAQLEIDFGNGEGRAAIRAGRVKASLPTLPPADFPELAIAGDVTAFSLPAKAFAAVLSTCSFAISTEETRHYLNGISMQADDSTAKLKFCATDGHQLAYTAIALPKGIKDLVPVILAREFCEEALRLIDKSEDDVALRVTKNLVEIAIGGVVFVSRLVDGTFPDYERVIPRGNPKKLTADIEAFTEALALCGAVAEGSRGVRLDLSTAGAKLSIRNPDKGDVEDDFEVEYAGEPLEIGFNLRYAQNILGKMRGEQFMAELGSAGDPVLFLDPHARESRFVLMPLRV